MTDVMKSGGPRSEGPPRRSPIALIAPIAVGVLTLGLIAWTAWPALKPVREVRVTQAVFDRGGEAQGVDERDGAPETATKTVQAPGWLEAEPWTVSCTALADGVVASMEVQEGEYVEEGAVVARLIAEDAELRLAVAEARLAEARAALGVAVAEFDAARTDWEEPVERERAVRSGRAALAKGEAELERLPAMIREARATLRGLEEELDRNRASFENGAINDLEVILSAQGVAAQSARVEALEAQRPVLEAEVERLRSELRAAERHLELRVMERRALGVAEAALAGAEAALARARAEHAEAALELERMVVRAPISGYVQRRVKKPGDKVRLGSDNPESAHLVELYNHAALRVRVDVPLADAAHVRIGQRCEVVVEVLPDRTFDGVVLRTTHEADLQKNTLEVQVRVIDPAPILRPEMLTRVRFVGVGASRSSAGATGVRTPSVLVPASTIVGGAVWAVRDRRGERGVVRRVAVTIVDEPEPGWTLVSGSVRPGELLVSEPAGVRDGQPVHVTNTDEKTEGGTS